MNKVLLKHTKKILLSDDHAGLRVNYNGLLTQSRAALIRGHKPGLAEMLRQFEESLDELGQRWYAGDYAVVDEFLQFFLCCGRRTKETQGVA